MNIIRTKNSKSINKQEAFIACLRNFAHPAPGAIYDAVLNALSFPRYTRIFYFPLSLTFFLSMSGNVITLILRVHCPRPIHVCYVFTRLLLLIRKQFHCPHFRPSKSPLLYTSCTKFNGRFLSC